jgi:predicted amidohydrolase YtcJ
VWIEDGLIRDIGSNLERSADTVIDAHQLTLLPGVIDPQVHFREPGLEHKEDLFTASCACARSRQMPRARRWPGCRPDGLPLDAPHPACATSSGG